MYFQCDLLENLAIDITLNNLLFRILYLWKKLSLSYHSYFLIQHRIFSSFNYVNLINFLTKKSCKLFGKKIKGQSFPANDQEIPNKAKFWSTVLKGWESLVLISIHVTKGTPVADHFVILSLTIRQASLVYQ